MDLVIYFVPWVVLIALCIFAIPVASLMDRRSTAAAYGPSQPTNGGEWGGGDEGLGGSEIGGEGGEPGQTTQPTDQGFGENLAEFGEGTIELQAPDGDPGAEFPAFDENMS